jgi:hypothetical protein
MDNTSLPSIIHSHRVPTTIRSNNDLYAIAKQRKELVFVYKSRLKKEIRMTENRILMIQKEQSSSQQSFKAIKYKVKKMQEIQRMKEKLNMQVMYSIIIEVEC